MDMTWQNNATKVGNGKEIQGNNRQRMKGNNKTKTTE